MLIEFFKVYRLYRRVHTARYSLRRAWQITFQGVPF
jgi:hypothetical protein